MSGPILIKLNVSKVDKTHLFQGRQGKYLDVILLPNKGGQDQYGNDFMAVQGPRCRREGRHPGQCEVDGRETSNRNDNRSNQTGTDAIG